MMNRAIYILALIATTSIFSSCTERIDLELNDDQNQRLVVEGWITDRMEKHEVELTLTSSYFANQPAPRATGATVSISDGDETWFLTEEEPGKYRTEPFAATPDKYYTLTVMYDDEEYTATSYMRPVAPIDSLHVRILDPLEEFGFPADPYYSVRIWTQELPGIGDHYMWRTFVNNEALRDTLSELSFVDDELYDGAYVADVEIDFLEIDEEAQIGDTVTVEQWNIGPEAYDVFIGIMNETTWNGGPFDAPPGNVPSNISNGALGYFGAAGLSEGSAIIME